MICPKCNASIPDESQFCPYCGEEKLVVQKDEEIQNEEEAVETEKSEETEETEVKEEMEGDKVIKPASAGTRAAVIIVSALVIIAAIAAAFFLGKSMSKAPSGTPAQTTQTSEVPDGEITDPGFVSNPDFKPFPDDYELVYPKGFDFLGTDFSQYVVLGEYKGLEVEIDSGKVTDEEVKDYIENYLLPSFPAETEVTGRAAEDGDIVYINYSGSIDGVVFDGGTASNQRVEIGAGGFIDGFEEGLVGMNIGDVKVVDCFFPENYHSADLAGKTAQFEMTLLSIVEEELPEYNDAFVAENTPYKTMAELEEYLKSAMESENAQSAESSKPYEMLNAICANAEFKGLPEGLVEDYMYGEIVTYKNYAASYEMDYESFLNLAAGMSVEQFETEVRTFSEEYIKQEFVLWAVINAENITVTPEEEEAHLPVYLSNLGVDSLQALIDASGATEDEIRVVIRKQVAEQKALEFLLENTTFKVVE